MAIKMNLQVMNSGPDYYSSLLKTAILKCQWQKNYCKATKKCEMCYHKFECHTMIAKKFHIAEASTIWRTYEVFAEDRDDAQELWNYWLDEYDIVELIDEDSQMHDYDITQHIPSLKEEKILAEQWKEYESQSLPS